MNKSRTTIYIDNEIYKQFQIFAIKNNKSVSELIEEFMKQTIKK